MKQKVVVVVSGGIVQSVMASHTDIEIQVIDCDNLTEDGLSNSQIDTAIQLDTEGLTEAWPSLSR